MTDVERFRCVAVLASIMHDSLYYLANLLNPKVHPFSEIHDLTEVELKLSPAHGTILSQIRAAVEESECYKAIQDQNVPFDYSTLKKFRAFIQEVCGVDFGPYGHCEAQAELNLHSKEDTANA